MRYTGPVAENKRLLQEAKLELKKSKRKDYYKILGVNKQATEDEIKKAYRKRALIHHPGELTETKQYHRRALIHHPFQPIDPLQCHKRALIHHPGQPIEPLQNPKRALLHHPGQKHYSALTHHPDQSITVPQEGSHTSPRSETLQCLKRALIHHPGQPIKRTRVVFDGKKHDIEASLELRPP